MYSRRLISRLSNASPAAALPSANARAFTSATAQLNKYSSTPALSDIAPEQGHLFDAKQKEFRENLAEQNRKRKEKERQSASSASAKSTSNSSESFLGQGLGSLSSAAGEAAR